MHNIVSKFVKMQGEKEEYIASGSTLMSGVKLTQGFAATGYNEETRFFQDFGSRIYFMEEYIPTLDTNLVNEKKDDIES